MLLCKYFDIGSRYSEPTIPTLFGLECEIEGLNTDCLSHVEEEFRVVEDGSLRNNGREFLTRPSSKQETLDLFQKLHSMLEYKDPEQKFSQRTSIHVHVNCKNLQVEQVTNILKFYALFEECFFSLVERSRRDNIHCVPLTETHLSLQGTGTLIDKMGRWSKYTALNALPLSRFGTLEFRHMQGHDDVQLLDRWLSAIEGLFAIGASVPLTQDNLTKDNVHRWASEIFKGEELILCNLDVLIEQTLLDVKLGVE